MEIRLCLDHRMLTSASYGNEHLGVYMDIHVMSSCYHHVNTSCYGPLKGDMTSLDTWVAA